MGDYTEGEDAPSLEDELVPTWNALDAPVSLYDICIRDILEISHSEGLILAMPIWGSKEEHQTETSQGMNLTRVFLLNKEVLTELRFGDSLTEIQLTKVKQMLMSHSQCLALTLDDVGWTTTIKYNIQLKPKAKLVYRPIFERFSQPELHSSKKKSRSSSKLVLYGK